MRWIHSESSVGSKRLSSPMDEKSRSHRRTILDILRRAGRGHIGSAFSVLEIVRVLYEDVLHVDPSKPGWPDRDRFILSKGHGCLGLYVEMAERRIRNVAPLFNQGAA